MSVTVDQNIQVSSPGMLVAFPVKVSTAILKNTICIVNKDGYLEPLTSSNYHQGVPVITYEAQASSSTAGSISGTLETGTNVVRCYVSGVFKMTGSGFAQNDVGNTCWATDNYTVGVTQNSGLQIGTVVGYLSATSVYVALNTYMINPGQYVFKAAFTTTSATSGGNMLNLANPVGETILIEEFIVDITTASTEASTIDAGVAASATSNDTLIDGLSVASLGTFSNLTDPGTNGGIKKCLSSQYITMTPKTGNTKSTAGTVIIKYRHFQ